MINNPIHRIARIHEQAFIIDAHFDLLSEVASRRDRGERQVIENRYLKRPRTGKMNLIVAPIDVEDIFLPESVSDSIYATKSETTTMHPNPSSLMILSRATTNWRT